MGDEPGGARKRKRGEAESALAEPRAQGPAAKRARGAEAASSFSDGSAWLLLEARIAKAKRKLARAQNRGDPKQLAKRSAKLARLAGRAAAAAACTPIGKAARIVDAGGSDSDAEGVDAGRKHMRGEHAVAPERTVYLQRSGARSWAEFVLSRAATVAHLAKDAKKELELNAQLDDISLLLITGKDAGDKDELVALDSMDTIDEALAKALGRAVAPTDKVRIVVDVAAAVASSEFDPGGRRFRGRAAARHAQAAPAGCLRTHRFMPVRRFYLSLFAAASPPRFTCSRRAGGRDDGRGVCGAGPAGTRCRGRGARAAQPSERQPRAHGAAPCLVRRRREGARHQRAS